MFPGLAWSNTISKAPETKCSTVKRRPYSHVKLYSRVMSKESCPSTVESSNPSRRLRHLDTETKGPRRRRSACHHATLMMLIIRYGYPPLASSYHAVCQAHKVHVHYSRLLSISLPLNPNLLLSEKLIAAPSPPAEPSHPLNYVLLLLTTTITNRALKYHSCRSKYRLLHPNNLPWPPKHTARSASRP
jgi:hypothetical protein